MKESVLHVWHERKGAVRGEFWRFAERVLPKASESWVHASLDQRQRLQQLFLPERVPFDGKRFGRTAGNASAFNYLRPIQQGN